MRPSVPVSIQVLRNKTFFNANYRATQRFSRHAQVQMVLKYDDNQRLPSTDERLDIRIDLGKAQKFRCC
jgi:hypothetical protein